MKIQLIVTKKDLSTGEYNLLNKGIGDYNNSCLTYFDKENNYMDIKIGDNEISCYRRSELKIIYNCVKNQQSSMFISGEHGDFELKLFTHELVIENNSISVDYEILNGSDENDRFLINWSWQESKDE